MKWHPDKNQGDAFGLLSVYHTYSNAHMLTWLAFGMCCMRTDCKRWLTAACLVQTKWILLRRSSR